MEIRRLKLTFIRHRISSTRLQRIFLSQAGPRFDLELFQAEHHLLFDVVWPPSNKKGDPLLGRPRLACFCG
jgi:hypothetical protein